MQKEVLEDETKPRIEDRRIDPLHYRGSMAIAAFRGNISDVGP